MNLLFEIYEYFHQEKWNFEQEPVRIRENFMTNP
jgi:hypothetical protein